MTQELTVTANIESDKTVKVKVHASEAIPQPSGNDSKLGDITITLTDENGRLVMTCSGIELTLKKS